MSRGVITRLLALAMTVLAGFSYILFSVIGWRVGAQRYPVTVMLTRAGGIYPEADVTYRGVVVGRVTSLALSRDGVAVRLGIDAGVRIPVDSSAAVRELSAAGEQYMDLVPRRPGGPELHAGSVIGQARTSVPTSIDTTLIDFGQLLSSIHTTDIENLNRALAGGFGGTGGQLHTLLAQTDNLILALRSSQAATVQLQVGGGTVLRSALATNNEFAQFTAQLQLLSARFAASDPDLRALMTNGIAAESGLSTVLSNDSSNLESLVNGLATVSDTAFLRNPAIQSLFQVLPVFAGQLALTASNGHIHGELLYNGNNSVCPYLPASQVPAPTATTNSPDLNNGCTSQASDLLQRGAAHAPAPPGG